MHKGAIGVKCIGVLNFPKYGSPPAHKSVLIKGYKPALQLNITVKLWHAQICQKLPSNDVYRFSQFEVCCPKFMLSKLYPNLRVDVMS